MDIETARPEDLFAIRQLLLASYLPVEDLTAAHLHDFILLRDGDELAGVVGLEVVGTYGLLRSLAVTVKRRGDGLGRKLVQAIEAHASQRGVRSLYLLTSGAADYFTRLGYRREARASAPAEMQTTTEFRDLCPDSAVCMLKVIGDVSRETFSPHSPANVSRET